MINVSIRVCDCNKGTISCVDNNGTEQQANNKTEYTLYICLSFSELDI